jgi:histidinol dehydrogenase
MIQIFSYMDTPLDEILPRGGEEQANISGAVSDIIASVRKNGDDALIDYSRRFDGVELNSLERTETEIDAAVATVDGEFIEVLKKAAKNIERFHTAQVRQGFTLKGDDGTVMGQKIIPIERVGLYIPGGTASYPSSALMNAIPAKIAGVSEIIMTTPPDKNGSVNPNILAAARIAGVDRVFKIGGAQAVAALAYGTKSVPRVDKIVGPGNAYVAEAKRQVYGVVGIDMIAGPSDVTIIADGSCNTAHVAADMLAQAEHDALATAILITDSPHVAFGVMQELERQLNLLPRQEIARTSIETRGRIIIADSIGRAVDIANAIAPEHLELCINDAFECLEAVKNAGSVFLGRNTPEALGDYLAGPNHTLPTLGTARFSSPLSVDDFIKKTQFTFFPRTALREVGSDVALFAEREGLSAHARSVTMRLDTGDGR